MSISIIQKGIVFIEVISAIIFFVANWQADRALDKSGIGDPERFTYWNNIAGSCFKVFALAWVCVIVVEVGIHVKDHGIKSMMKIRLPYYVTLSPLVASILWVISIL